MKNLVCIQDVLNLDATTVVKGNIILTTNDIRGWILIFDGKKHPTYEDIIIDTSDTNIKKDIYEKVIDHLEFLNARNK